MEKRIVYTRPDGGVSVIIPAPGVPMERVMQDVPADATDAAVVDVADLPADRTFRNAWKHDAAAPGRVGADLPKATPIAHDKRRAKRAQEFAPLDIEATIPAKAAQAEAARQVIRDKYDVLQTEIDAAATPADLLAIITREGL